MLSCHEELVIIQQCAGVFLTFVHIIVLWIYGCSWDSRGLPNKLSRSSSDIKYGSAFTEQLLTGIVLQRKLFVVLEYFPIFFPEGRMPSGYLSKELAAEPAAQIFPETHATTSCIKLSLQWFIIMNHENSQPVQCLWVSPLHTNIHSHTQIIKKDKGWRVQRGKKNKIKIMLQSQKHSALPRRAFICTTIFQNGMGANCTSIEKKRSEYLQLVPGESWSNHLYIKLHFLQITIDIQK